MFDLTITGGTVVDGTGAARYRADIGIKDGRIAEIRRRDGDGPGIEVDAAQTIDATGLVVAPGFVDPHTHYDAQITWDPLLSSSAEHGVTTVVMGNCGVGLAPCRPADRELLTDDLVTVEGIDKEVLSSGIRWDWETFPQYLEAVAAMQPVLNVGSLFGHSALRYYVLDDAAAVHD